MKIFSSFLYDVSNTRLKNCEKVSMKSSSMGVDDGSDDAFDCEYAKFIRSNFDIKVDSVLKVKSRIAPILNSCKYGKQNLFSDLDSLEVYEENGQLYLSGFYCPKDKDGELTGICEELTQKAGEKIAKMFQDEYSVIALFTAGTKYGFQNHMCIGMIKRNKENDEIIATIEENGELLRKIQQYSRLGKDTAELWEQFNQKSKENAIRIDGCDFWKDAILVDPSLNFVTSLNNLPNDYELTSFNSLEGNNPFRRVKQLTDNLSPLGFAKDIFPEIINKEGFCPKALVSFGLCTDVDKICVLVENLGDNREVTFVLDSLRDKYPKSNLCKFVERIESQLQEV